MAQVVWLIVSVRADSFIASGPWAKHWKIGKEAVESAMTSQTKPFAAIFVAAALTCNAATPARAWLDSFGPNATFIWHWQPVLLNLDNHGSQTTSQSSKGKRGRRAKKVSVSKRPSAVKTSFRPSVAVRKRNFARFVAKSRAVDPQGAEQLRQALASGNIMADLGKAIAPYGFKTNDVADAMTVYLVGAWSGAQGRNDNPTRAQCAGVRRQIAFAALRTPSFAAARDAQKQELAEAMLIQAVMIDQAVTAAKNNPQMMGKLKVAIAQGAQRTFGLDMTRVQLTDAGVKLIGG